VAAMSCPNPYDRCLFDTPIKANQRWPKVPPLLMPLNAGFKGKDERNMVLKELPTLFPSCLVKDWRRKTAMALIKMTANAITDTSLRFLNVYFFQPSKTESEFAQEVLTKRKEAGISSFLQRKQGLDDLKLDRFVFDLDTQLIYWWDPESRLWCASSLDYIKEANDITPLNANFRDSSLLAYIKFKVGVSFSESAKSRQQDILLLSDGLFTISGDGSLFPLVMSEEDVKALYIVKRVNVLSTELARDLKKTAGLSFEAILNHLWDYFPVARAAFNEMLDCDADGMAEVYLQCLISIVGMMYLKSLNFTIQIQRIVIASGIGGSGKSTLID